MKFKKLEFSNAAGQRLSARIDLPEDQTPVAYALFAHCFTCSKNIKAISNISRALTREGIAVLRFDFTGLGESEGDFADTNFSSNVDDLVMAAEFMADNYRSPKILILHSPTDDVVDIQNAAKIFQTARHPKSFISLDSADHLLMDKKDSLYAGSIIATWALRYLGTEVIR